MSRNTTALGYMRKKETKMTRYYQKIVLKVTATGHINMEKYQRIEPLLMKAWTKATKQKDNNAMSNLRIIAMNRPKVPIHMRQWLADYIK